MKTALSFRALFLACGLLWACLWVSTGAWGKPPAPSKDHEAGSAKVAITDEQLTDLLKFVAEKRFALGVADFFASVSIRDRAFESLKKLRKCDQAFLQRAALEEERVWQPPETNGKEMKSFNAVMDKYAAWLGTWGIKATRSDLLSAEGRKRIGDALKKRADEIEEKRLSFPDWKADEAEGLVPCLYLCDQFNQNEVSIQIDGKQVFSGKVISDPSSQLGVSTHFRNKGRIVDVEIEVESTSNKPAVLKEKVDLMKGIYVLIFFAEGKLFIQQEENKPEFY